MERAFITGVSGQDGSFLADLLLAEGLEVYGLIRRKADSSGWRIRHLAGNPAFTLVDGDMLDPAALIRELKGIRPRYVFNLAAQSFVPFSWQAPSATSQVTALGVLHILEAIRAVDPSIRFYQASSSEMFGNAPEAPQNESTPFNPRSPYGVSKVFGHHITVNYRESYGMFACSGILFNHESERRGLQFVTRKVTHAAALIKRGLEKKVALGNLDSSRDWGYAPDYVQAMWMMLRADSPGDYVIASGKSHTVRELCQAAFGAAGLDWQEHVEVDERFKRPAELYALLGDAGKAKKELGWEPEVSFGQMVEKMLAADLKRVDEGITWET
ncbi:GDP-mannose 4,6-dehydratase [bacterium]|nr:GDP-mannose 4,6-dehydratase [bacterium]